jgi:hypothetical protein
MVFREYLMAAGHVSRLVSGRRKSRHERDPELSGPAKNDKRNRSCTCSWRDINFTLNSTFFNQLIPHLLSVGCSRPPEIQKHYFHCFLFLKKKDFSIFRSSPPVTVTFEFVIFLLYSLTSLHSMYRSVEIAAVSISHFTLVIKLTTARVDTLHKNAALKSYSDLI